MKCPVCDLENSTMLCPGCGFDASRDYARYPTFGPVGRIPTPSAQRKEWQRKTAPKIDGPRHVDYLKMVSEAAQKEADKREQHYEQRLFDYLAPTTTYRELSAREALMRQENDAQIDALLEEIGQLREKLQHTTKQYELNYLASIERLIREKEHLERENSDLRTRSTILESELNAANDRVAALEKKKHAIEQDLQNWKKYHTNLSRQIGSQRLQIRELEAALEAERSKGIVARIFNR